jgi:hypothetical protein
MTAAHRLASIVRPGRISPPMGAESLENSTQGVAGGGQHRMARAYSSDLPERVAPSVAGGSGRLGRRLKRN